MARREESQLVTRYTANYGIADDVHITDKMVHRHWSLEQELRQRLLLSTPDGRWATFEDCYTTLYTQLPWLD